MIPEGVKVQLTDFKSVLSVEEHNFLVKKLIAQFEMNVAALSADAARSTSLGESWVRFCFLYVSDMKFVSYGFQNVSSWLLDEAEAWPGQAGFLSPGCVHVEPLHERVLRAGPAA